jgi:hypothetical protein
MNGVEQWTWRGKTPADMPPQHLCNVVVAIWHEVMPPKYRIRSQIAPNAYIQGMESAELKVAFEILLRELTTRGGVEPWITEELHAMQAILCGEDPLAPEAVPAYLDKQKPLEGPKDG